MSIVVPTAITKPEEKIGGRIREALGLDYSKVSDVVKRAWTQERRERIKEVARAVGQGVAQVWEEDETLSKIAGTLSNEMFNKVTMDPGDRAVLKASRFKYHDGTGKIYIVALPVVAKLNFAHKLKTGAVAYAVGGFFGEYERTAKGLSLVNVYWRGKLTASVKDLVDVIRKVKPEVLEKARNKQGMRLKEALAKYYGITVG